MKKLLSCLLILSCVVMNAQVQAPQPSPHAKLEQKVGLTDVTITYSRPGMKGRSIFGDLVPYGEVWRTGANENTVITFSDDVKIGGKELPAGSYSIYTRPNRDSWEVMFYKTTDNWGNPQEWEESQIALKTTAAVETLPFEVETFTIFINNLTNDSAVIQLIWADTVANVPFTVPTDEMTMASIEETMNGSNATVNDYYGAAAYYRESGKDLEKAHEWISKAAEMGGEEAFWIWRLKSLIEADMGKKEQAIATAKKSLESAKKANNADYVKMNQESIEEWGGKK